MDIYLDRSVTAEVSRWPSAAVLVSSAHIYQTVCVKQRLTSGLNYLLFLLFKSMKVCNESSEAVQSFRHESAADRKWCRTFNGEVLDGAAFSAAAVWRQTEATDTPSCPNPRAQNVVRIQIISTLKDSREKVDQENPGERTVLFVQSAPTSPSTSQNVWHQNQNHQWTKRV